MADTPTNDTPATADSVIADSNAMHEPVADQTTDTGADQVNADVTAPTTETEASASSDSAAEDPSAGMPALDEAGAAAAVAEIEAPTSGGAENPAMGSLAAPPAEGTTPVEPPADSPVPGDSAASAEAPTSEAPASEVPAGAETASAEGGRRPRQPSMEQVMESDEFAAYMSGAETLARNTLVGGTVVRLEDNGSILVDIGHKSEGIIPRNEAGDDEIGVGDEVECVVIRSEDEEGHPVLSKRRADYERTKRNLAVAKDSGEIMQATVKEAVKGGIIVDLGMGAFVPASHVEQRMRGQLERLVGQVIPVKVIEVDFRKSRDKIIASHRLAFEEEREANRTQALANLEKDKIVEGVVRRITDFGAFIDLGGIDGLLHVREMAWSRVEHPNQVVRKGQTLQVLVLDIDEERDRIALGLKQLLPDPWKKAAKNYKTGQVVTIKILRIAPTVAFVELEPGVEAILPISEMSEERIGKPEDVITIGQEVESRIKSIQPNQRRITVSLRAAAQERERRETRSAVREVNQRAQESSQVRLGDLFGKELRALRNRRRDAEDESSESADDVEQDLDDVATLPADELGLGADELGSDAEEPQVDEINATDNTEDDEDNA